MSQNRCGVMGFRAIFIRELRRLACRPIYLFTMIIVPIGCAIFFVSLLDEGLPTKVPTAVVDHDNSLLSRQIIRDLGASELINIDSHLDSYHEALESVRSGKVFGFFIIPDDFEKDAVAGRSPSISYYCNMAYFIPGTLTFKGFKTIAVSTTGSLARVQLVSAGMNDNATGALIQPLAVQDHPIGNPWSNYPIYLCNSFAAGVLALMILLVTAFSICEEIKRATSIEWLATARGSMIVALLGKMLPHTVIFSAVGIFMQSLFYGYNHYPLNGSEWVMALAMVMFVVACQAFALFVCCLLPNLRLALSVVSLLGVLSFSITGFSFPLENMYGAVAIFSYIIPVRYYFLIYIDQALNGIALYYSRYYFIALAIFPLVASTMLWRLKKACITPIYVS